MSRGGGTECPYDDSEDFTFTVIVWCNDEYSERPQDIKFVKYDPEKANVRDGRDEDPCNIYVTMQHASGCKYFSFWPFLKIIGIGLLSCGVFLKYNGQKT